MKVIGVSAFAARSGKDTFAKCLQVVLTERGKTSIIRSLATPLKDKTAEFIFNHFGVNVFDCTDEEKSLIRPLLVAYGWARRTQTEGKYWTRLMDGELSKMEEEDVDYVIIPDIRYAEYASDEVSWLKGKNAPLFYIEMILEDGSLLQPPNEDERVNGPRLRDNADVIIKWPHMTFEECLVFVRNNFYQYERYL